MEITEEGRHEMYLRFDEVLGREVATMLMSHLPPVGWADVATKQDLDLRFEALRHELRGEMHRLGGEFRAEIHQAVTKLVFAFIAANATMAGLALAASRVI